MRRCGVTLYAFLWSCGVALATSPEERPAGPAGGTETIDQALCRMIEGAAAAHRLPVEFFTRLIWRESSFRPGVTSPAGAQGVAQFMPGTAAERGLADPFDPEEAIPKSAELLAELKQRFGNLGLAAAAYNGGPARVASWLEGRGGLPAETRDYVAIITRRSVDDWAAEAKGQLEEAEPDNPRPASCVQLAATFRRPVPGGDDFTAEAPIAPWGVQLAGNFSKARALASYTRARHAYAAIIGDAMPMIIGTRLRSRGTRAFYRVRVPAATRAAANELCTRIRAVGGACIVLRS